MKSDFTLCGGGVFKETDAGGSCMRKNKEADTRMEHERSPAADRHASMHPADDDVLTRLNKVFEERQHYRQSNVVNVPGK